MMVVLNDLKNNLNGFLKANALWIALALVGVILIVVALILIFGNAKKKKPDVKIAEKSLWVLALGGEGNIVSSEAYGSRLAVVLKDKEKMNREELKKLGVTNFIEMSNKITLLLEDKAELVKAELDK